VPRTRCRIHAPSGSTTGLPFPQDVGLPSIPSPPWFGARGRRYHSDSAREAGLTRHQTWGRRVSAGAIARRCRCRTRGVCPIEPPFLIKLVFWGDWSFPRGGHQSCGLAIALSLRACHLVLEVEDVAFLGFAFRKIHRK
jgi:hypothetical protein